MFRFLLFVFLSVTVLFSQGLGNPNTVVLTAKDVDSARAIEIAIEEATMLGAEAGTVLLDASEGPFIYTQADRSINIYYSNVTLRSVNGAQITNCADGVFFDDFAIQNVTIEGITFDCEAGGILVPLSTQGHEYERVTIRKNTIDSLTIGIRLAGVNGSKVLGNHITAEEQGIFLANGTNDNLIIQNTIYDVEHFGIALEGDNFDNKIHGNKVFCVDCLTVDASLEVLSNNKISGNKP